MNTNSSIIQALSKHGYVIIYAVLSLFWCRNFFPIPALDGHVMTSGDPALNAWALNWVSRALSGDVINLFNGNAFFPHSNSIALSEHMVSLAVLIIPIRWFTENPWVGYNAMIFLAYLISAIGAHALLMHTTRNKMASFWGGIFWGFFFFRIHHIGHLQILAYQWFPLVALFLLRTLEQPTLRNAAGLWLFFTLQALTSWYLAVVVTLLGVIIFACNVTRAMFNLRHSLVFISTALLVALVIFPFAEPYFNALKDTSLSERLTDINSVGDQVKLLDYFFPPDATFLGSLIKGNKYWIWQENTLFIGFSAVALSLLGIIYGFKENARMVISALCMILVGYTFALGYVSATWGVKLPLFYFAEKFPFVAAIRATQRYSLLIYFGVLILSAYGISYLSSIFRPRIQVLLTVLFVSIFLFEVYPYKVPFEHPKSYSPSHLDKEIRLLQREVSSPLVVIHYPIYTAMPGYPVQEATYMLDSTLHWANIVNGFSGATPNGFKEDMQTLNSIPSENALALMKKYKVNVVAVHASLPKVRRDELLGFFKSIDGAIIRRVSQEEYLVILDK